MRKVLSSIVPLVMALLVMPLLVSCGGSSRPGPSAAAPAGPNGAVAPTSAERSSGANDPAVAALHAAVMAMRAAPSFRFDAAIELGSVTSRVGGEFQAPDRLHETVTPPKGSPVELVFIATQAFVKDPKSGAWRSRPSTGPATSDPRAAFEALNQATNVRLAEGEYRFTLPRTATASLARLVGGAATPNTATGTATLTGVAIGRLTIDLPGTPRAQLTVTYRGLGAAPPVQQPTAG
jgi:hypothetical protein